MDESEYCECEGDWDRMRPIDADALIARLEDDASHMEMPVVQMCTYAAINDIKKEPTVAVIPQWIPVSERLPDEAGTYMVTDYAGGISEVATDEYFCRDDGKPVWMYSQNVVAWMPLPTAYTEGQE